MRYTIWILCIVPVVLWTLSIQEYALSETGGESRTGESVVDVGNKICPVTGTKVSGSYFVTYQGKRYGLCCPMCEEMFLKDPDKYIARLFQLEPQLQESMSMPASTSTSIGTGTEHGSMPHETTN
ncbi:MAG: YHS domain-containing protein [Candidatus Omnitrophica bacterium]|nr:YHS domain-containing protein [Candidatus Omnitrophota bacterium]